MSPPSAELWLFGVEAFSRRVVDDEELQSSYCWAIEESQLTQRGEGKSEKFIALVDLKFFNQVPLFAIFMFWTC